jgi:hypothetical protein
MQPGRATAIPLEHRLELPTLVRQMLGFFAGGAKNVEPTLGATFEMAPLTLHTDGSVARQPRYAPRWG